MFISLKAECKSLGIPVSKFSELVDVSPNTLRDWCESRPLLMIQLFKGVRANFLISEMLENSELLGADSKLSKSGIIKPTASV